MSLVVLIPAYEPSTCLVAQLQALAESKQFAALIVVNDGSSPACQTIFAQAARIAGVTVVAHPVNLGKGAALKSGFAYALRELPSLAGVVTADADGQHLTADVLRVGARLQSHPHSLVLGARGFEGDVPLRSRFGNQLTRFALRLVAGHTLTDTQTGLRGIPAALLPSLLKLPSSGYEFELDMLLTAKQIGCPIEEIPIQTVYEPGNRSSHFNPLLDSMKIYFILLRFSSASVLTAILDNSVFYLVWKKTGRILESQAIGRAVAVAFNYLVVRRAVFQTRQQHRDVLWRYLLLVVVSGTVSYLSIRGLTAIFPIPVPWAKIGVESVIFFANFYIQRRLIFNRPVS